MYEIGYATTDLSLLSFGTLIIFILLMGVKPQMVFPFVFLFSLRLTLKKKLCFSYVH